MTNPIYSAISRQTSLLIAQAREAAARRDTRAKADAEMRIRFLITLRKQVDAASRSYPHQSVFISYSPNSGQHYFEIAAEIAGRYGFEVITGFQKPEAENVLQVVLEAIKEASVFLSILTPEYGIRRLQGAREPRTAPSVWLIEEKGMALALGKPFRLMIEESVHSDYWKRTTPEKLQTKFTMLNFEKQADVAIRALYQRYHELLNSVLTAQMSDTVFATAAQDVDD